MKLRARISVVVLAGICAAGTSSAQGPRGEFGDHGIGPGGRPAGPPPGGFGGRGMDGFGMGSLGGPQSYVTGAPYSAVEVVQTTEPLADGNSINHKSQTVVHRDGQGRVRTEQTVTPPTSSGKQPYTIVTILDYVAGTRYLLDSSTMTATQSPLRIPATRTGGASSPSGRRGPGGGTESSPMAAPMITRTTLNPQMVNGVLASGTHHVQTIPAGEIGNEKAIQISRQMWISNDLKVPVQIRSSDPRFGTTVMDLTNIVSAEPSQSLFVVPAGYTVKTRTQGGSRPTR